MKKRLVIFAIALLALLTLACATAIHEGGVASQPPRPLALSFEGEYRQGDGEWEELTDKTRLSADEGDLMLRGSFPVDIPEGARLNYYQNHLAVTLILNGEVYGTNAPASLGLHPFLCEELWEYWIMPEITSGEVIEIHLVNLHQHGNESAYRDFLATLCLTPNEDTALSTSLEPFAYPFNLIGLTLLILTIMILEAAVSASLRRMPTARTLWTFCLLCASAGGYFIFDTISFSLSFGHMAWSTYGRCLCALYFALGVLVLAAVKTSGVRHRIMLGVVAASVAIDAILLALVFLDAFVIFDMIHYWKLVQIPLGVICGLCCVAERLKGSPANALYATYCIVISITMLMDVGGIGDGLVSSATCTKVAFVILALIHVSLEVKNNVVMRQKASQADKLEEELENSRVALMLSQMSPHFLYNVLNTIYHLCGQDPKKAQSAIGSFSDYLRGNMDSLEKEGVTPFKDELKHVHAYLDLEKIRFGDNLNVEFDIQESNFFLPALTVQTLVENAVKHGVSKKRGGGTVRISTRSLPNCIEIEIKDDGVGFDPNAKTEPDGKTHLGIRNARKRLENIVGGTLSITSAPGEGTSALVRIPKER